MLSKTRRSVLVALLVALTLVQGSVRAQSTPTPRSPDSNHSQPLVLSKADVDQLKAAASAKEARALVVATVERVERRPISETSSSANILFHLFSDGGPVVAARRSYGRDRLEERFATNVSRQDDQNGCEPNQYPHLRCSQGCYCAC